jgi:hypothetical protein
LKRKKTPGRDGIQNEPLIYGTEWEVDRLLEMECGRERASPRSGRRG